MESLRIEAARQGLVRYMGKPCKRGHVGERYVSTGRCVECDRNAARLFYLTNKRIIQEAKMSQSLED